MTIHVTWAGALESLGALSLACGVVWLVCNVWAMVSYIRGMRGK